MPMPRVKPGLGGWGGRFRHGDIDKKARDGEAAALHIVEEQLCVAPRALHGGMRAVAGGVPRKRLRFARRVRRGARHGAHVDEIDSEFRRRFAHRIGPVVEALEIRQEAVLAVGEAHDRGGEDRGRALLAHIGGHAPQILLVLRNRRCHVGLVELLVVVSELDDDEVARFKGLDDLPPPSFADKRGCRAPAAAMVHDGAPFAEEGA